MDENLQPDADPNSIDAEIEQQLIDFLKVLKGGKKPTLRDLLLYQRVLNYNAVVTYKNMTVLMTEVQKLTTIVKENIQNQATITSQIQEFLSAQKLIENIEKYMPKDPESPV